MKKKILQGLNYGNYSVSGKSFVYNQLVQNGNFADISAWNPYQCTYTVENNIAKIVKTVGVGSYLFFSQPVTGIAGHKYLLSRDIRANKNCSLEEYWGTTIGVSKTITIEWKNFNQILTYTSGANVNFVRNGSELEVGDYVEIKEAYLVDLTLLEQSLGTTINTLEDFYATEVGKQVKNGAYLPYSPTNTIYNATSPFRFVRNNGKEKLFAPETPITLRSAGAVADTWRNCSGKVKRNVGNVDLGSLNWIKSTSNYFYNNLTDIKQIKGVNYFSLDSDVFIIWQFAALNKNSVVIRNEKYKDMTPTEFKQAMYGVLLNYELATSTTEQAQSIALPKGVTHCYDANGVELQFKEI